MLVQINHLLFNCYMKKKSWGPVFVSVSYISRVEPQRQHACGVTDSLLLAWELWIQFWLVRARLSHSGNTLVVHTPL